MHSIKDFQQISHKLSGFCVDKVHRRRVRAGLELAIISLLWLGSITSSDLSTCRLITNRLLVLRVNGLKFFSHKCSGLCVCKVCRRVQRSARRSRSFGLWKMATNGKGKGAVAEEGSIVGLGKGSGLGSGSGSGSGAGGGSSGSGSEPPAPLAPQLSSGGGSGNIARPPRGTASKYDFVKVRESANGSKTMHA